MKFIGPSAEDGSRITMGRGTASEQVDELHAATNTPGDVGL